MKNLVIMEFNGCGESELSVMKWDDRLSPLGIVSTNECWLNVGPVLVSIGPTLS